MAAGGLGRLILPDDRDANYPMAAVVPARSERTWRYWWPSGWWGDQGQTPQCVAYALLHKLADGPVTHRDHPAPRMVPRDLYCEAQKIDPWTGDCLDRRYDGTSVRAGAKVLATAGLIREYRWAWAEQLDVVVRCLLEVGPVVVGTWWYAGMSDPDPDGTLHVSGAAQGGHAYVLNGVNTVRGVVRMKNSWGRRWGRDGYGWLTLDDLHRLLADDGEAVLPVGAR